MRTALILLFLLALAALPGALLPQSSLNTNAVADYIENYGWWGELLDRLQFFEIYGSVWFSAIYVLLMISLIGCLVPRTFEFVRQLRAKPVRTPRNMNRLPHHQKGTLAATPDEVIATARTRLRGWRTVESTEDSGARTISAERGFLRETGNLIFHFALLGLVVAFGLGGMFKYEGNVIVHANGSQFCNSGVYAFDSFRPGLSVDGTELTPLCVKVNEFHPEYLPTGQPVQYHAKLEYQAGEDLETGTWRPYDLEVNHPLRVEGDRVYLLDHGYAPIFTVTFPNGEKRTKNTQWRPVDPTTYLSEGAAKFDPPGITDPAERRKKQLAITGLFAPTAAFDGNVLSSAFPDLRDPAVAVDIMQGDLGIDSGRGQNIFVIDQSQVDKGALKRVARENMRPGEEITLEDGTKISFDGIDRWISIQVSRDATQMWVLVFSGAMLLGLGASLTVKRRRFWLRVAPAEAGEGTARTVVEVGGLARTDQAGYGEEFTKLAGDLLDNAAVSHREEN
nr:cytochrome c biogenesis protein ResB [Tamaricihabitans halophyticus]